MNRSIPGTGVDGVREHIGEFLLLSRGGGNESDVGVATFRQAGHRRASRHIEHVFGR